MPSFLYFNFIIEPLHKKTKNKTKHQSVIAQLISAFVVTSQIVPLLLIPKISSFLPASVIAQVGLCQTWLETQIIGFLAQRLM